MFNKKVVIVFKPNPETELPGALAYNLFYILIDHFLCRDEIIVLTIIQTIPTPLPLHHRLG